MDLILWRHAQAHEAEEGCDDLSRALTAKGEGQATRVGKWLDRQLPESTRVLVSPARRAEQTARALGRKFKFRDELGPECSADEALALATHSLLSTQNTMPPFASEQRSAIPG